MTRWGFDQERRRHARQFLDLPIEIRIPDLPDAYGGIAVDGSETGLLVHSVRDIPLGTRLRIALLFPNGFELADFQAIAEVIRKRRQPKEETGYAYGLRLVQIKEEDRLKLKYLLSGLHGLVQVDTFMPQSKSPEPEEEDFVELA